MLSISLGFIAMIERLEEGIPSITYRGALLVPKEPTPWRVMDTALSPATPEEVSTDRPATCPWSWSSAEDEGAFLRVSEFTVSTEPTSELTLFDEP